VPGIGGELEAVAELHPGDCFGVSALLGAEQGAELQAIEPVGLLVLDDEAVASVAGAYPSVAEALQGAKPAAAPAGGTRLSRLTIAPVRPVGVPDGALAGAGAAPVRPDVNRATRSLAPPV
jgi:hypothetical protein